MLISVINVNHPEKVGNVNYGKTTASIDELTRKGCAFVLGCNIYPLLTDYGFIWDLVKEYGLEHLRISVASPGGCLSNMKNKKDDYMRSSLPIFLDFCSKATEYGVDLHMDCGRIPRCYFTDQQWDIVRKAFPDSKCRPDTNPYSLPMCEPIIDIDPDCKAYSCMALSNSENKVSIDEFDDPKELYRYLYVKYTIPMFMKNAHGRCETCRMHELVKCQGGCLAFTNQ